MILERLHKRQDKPVTSESCDMSTSPSASQAILTLLFGPQRKWKREVEAEPRHRRRQEGAVRGRQKKEQGRWRLMTLAR